MNAQVTDHRLHKRGNVRPALVGSVRRDNPDEVEVVTVSMLLDVARRPEGVAVRRSLRVEESTVISFRREARALLLTAAFAGLGEQIDARLDAHEDEERDRRRVHPTAPRQSRGQS